MRASSRLCRYQDEVVSGETTNRNAMTSCSDFGEANVTPERDVPVRAILHVGRYEWCICFQLQQNTFDADLPSESTAVVEAG